MGGNAGAQGILNLRKNTQNNFGGTLVDSEGFFGGLTTSSPVIQFTYGTPIAINAELVAFVWISDPSLSSATVYDRTGNGIMATSLRLYGLRVFIGAGMTNQVAGLRYQRNRNHLSHGSRAR